MRCYKIKYNFRHNSALHAFADSYVIGVDGIVDIVPIVNDGESDLYKVIYESGENCIIYNVVQAYFKNEE